MKEEGPNAYYQEADSDDSIESQKCTDLEIGSSSATGEARSSSSSGKKQKPLDPIVNEIYAEPVL